VTNSQHSAVVYLVDMTLIATQLLLSPQAPYFLMIRLTLIPSSSSWAYKVCLHSRRECLIVYTTQQDLAQHGICGRGVFLDLVEFYTSGGSPLPYDPMSTHGVPVADLEACAKKQGVQFRQADILILRMGFIQKYMSLSQSARYSLGSKPETLSGLLFCCCHFQAR
jgi:hypothetical protein